MPDEPRATPLTGEAILHELPRLSLDDAFSFACDPSKDCFTRCCRDVNIVLTPYDILRMKRALGIDSSEFLERYTLSPFAAEQKIPVVLLKMDPESSRCLFVGPDGCSIYSNRPWACRMYPLGVAEPKTPSPQEKGFHFLIQEDLCHGHRSGQPVTVRQWLRSEGVEEYDMMGAPFRELMLHDFWESSQKLTPAQMDMFFMACYDLDRFRRFVFDTTFLQRFDVDEARVEAMRSSDIELLDFAMQWLRFSLFKEKTLRMRRAATETMRERMGNANG